MTFEEIEKFYKKDTITVAKELLGKIFKEPIKRLLEMRDWAEFLRGLRLKFPKY